MNGYLRRDELPLGAAALAEYLIGMTLVHETRRGVLSGRIVETEAYPPGDAAGHAFRGKSAANRALFLDRGHAYVYLAYGIHELFNVSSELPGSGGGVLVRALEPLDGIALMKKTRGISRVTELARGPGRLAAAMLITRRCDGVDLCTNGPLRLAPAVHPAGPIGRSIRIGITKETERLLRFYEEGSPFVSGPRAGVRARKSRDPGS